MVRTRQTAFLQLSRTPWTPRRKRWIWRARRIKAVRSSTGYSEPWSKKLRQPCAGDCCWKEQHINWHIPECRLRTSPWTPTTVHWRRSLALSEKLFGLPPASTGACVIHTFIYQRPTKFTFLPLVHSQKEGKTWIYSIVLQATIPGTRGVNGMDGDVTLERVQATADHTQIDASGEIDRKQGSRIAFSVANGRVQDLMRMFVHDGAPVTGAATLHAAAFVPAEHEHFLKAMQIKGAFALADMHFTHSQTQQTIDAFSQRASGTAPKKKDANADTQAPTVAAELNAPHVIMRDGVARFTNMLFTIGLLLPGDKK